MFTAMLIKVGLYCSYQWLVTTESHSKAVVKFTKVGATIGHAYSCLCFRPCPHTPLHMVDHCPLQRFLRSASNVWL